jgi:hypothetical protein
LTEVLLVLSGTVAEEGTSMSSKSEIVNM